MAPALIVPIYRFLYHKWILRFYFAFSEDMIEKLNRVKDTDGLPK
jgi:hypothetical protein